MKTYAELRLLNVSEHVEKKNNLSYLSWAWAVDQLFLADETATWEYKWFDNMPYLKIRGELEAPGDSYMVFCTVKAFGRERTAQLPIMNYKNQAMKQFTTFDLNTTMQRCLAKAISLHGIGLYIYAGEDLPPEAGEVLAEQVVKADAKPTAQESQDADTEAQLQEMASNIETLFRRGDIRGAFDEYNECKAKLEVEHQVSLRARLPSVVRTALQKHAMSLKEPA